MACGSSIYESGDDERGCEEGEEDDFYGNEVDDSGHQMVEEEKQLNDQNNKMKSFEIKRASLMEQECLSSQRN